jgi:hypothetical protein
MATMFAVGATSFTLNPARCTLPATYKSAAAVVTYGGVAFFSFGTYTAGQKIVLEWDYCNIATWNILQAAHVADAQTTLTPGDGFVYKAELLSLKGAIFLDQTTNAKWRKNVKLELIVISKAAA